MCNPVPSPHHTHEATSAALASKTRADRCMRSTAPEPAETSPPAGVLDRWEVAEGRAVPKHIVRTSSLLPILKVFPCLRCHSCPRHAVTLDDSLLSKFQFQYSCWVGPKSPPSPSFSPYPTSPFPSAALSSPSCSPLPPPQLPPELPIPTLSLPNPPPPESGPRCL